jgi:hypothetical protein
LILWGRGAGGGHLTVLGGWSHTTLPVFVEDQHGGTPLEARVSALAGPVSVAGFTEGHVTVGVILAQGMFLATSNILWPVTGVGLLVVQQATNTELFSGCSVPARPVPGAASLVAENSVQPVTVLGALGRISFRSAGTVHIVRIVTAVNKAEPAIGIVNKSVGTGLQESLALVAVIVQVTGRLVGGVLCIAVLAGLLAN